MSVFYCFRCDGYVDSDYVPCVEDPNKPEQFRLMCEEHQQAADLLAKRDLSVPQLSAIEAIKSATGEAMTPEERAESIYDFWLTAHNTELIKKFIAKEIYAAMAEAIGGVK
jgi:hypothetical protein